MNNKIRKLWKTVGEWMLRLLIVILVMGVFAVLITTALFRGLPILFY